MSKKKFLNYGIEKLETVILHRIKADPYQTAYAAYIAASIYPNTFRIDEMRHKLMGIFPVLGKKQARGTGNIIVKLAQTKPPLIEYRYSKHYRWNNTMINASEAVKMIAQLITTRFDGEVPDSETIESLRRE